MNDNKNEAIKTLSSNTLPIPAIAGNYVLILVILDLCFFVYSHGDIRFEVNPLNKSNYIDILICGLVIYMWTSNL